MSEIDRDWALNQLRHVGNSTQLTLAAMQLLNSGHLLALEGSKVVLNRHGIIFGATPDDSRGERFEVDYGEYIRDYKHDRPSLQATLRELWKSSRRALIKESYEVTLGYAKQKGLMEPLRNQPWYQFVRVIRNCLSHDFHFRFKDHTRSLLPVSWCNKEITAAMEDTDLPEDFLDPYTTWALFLEMVQFVKSN